MIYLRYLSYVLRHKWFVFVACCKLGIPLRGVVHDLSKFLPSEFIPYARRFYGYETGGGSKLYWDIAWHLHQNRNPHHPTYWIRRADRKINQACPFDMPYPVIKEMVADWIGAGKAQGNKETALDWYGRNKETMILSDNTRRETEKLLTALFLGDVIK